MTNSPAPARTQFALGLLVLFYFLALTGRGIQSGLTSDDLMNSYRAWYWGGATHLRDIALFFTFSETYRPLGALFYWSWMQLFGFDPLPLRAACYLLLAGNLCLSYLLVRKLSGDWRLALLSVLLFSYNKNFDSLYINSGYCYDLLCFAIYCMALLYYLEVRQSGNSVAGLRLIPLVLLYILALNAKEMAVTLPAAILAYEWLCSREPIYRNCQFVIVGSLMTAAFVTGRLFDPRGLAAVSAYRPTYSPLVFVRSLQHFLAAAGNLDHVSVLLLASLLLAALAVAHLRGRRDLTFSLAMLLLTILPVAFIPERPLSAYYLPMLWLCAVAATLIFEAASFFKPPIPFVPAFIALVIALGAANLTYARLDFDSLMDQGNRIGATYDRLNTYRRTIRKGSQVLFVTDPLPERTWDSTFLLYLITRDRGLQVRRLDYLREHPEQADGMTFNLFFCGDQDSVELCGRPPELGEILSSADGP